MRGAKSEGHDELEQLPGSGRLPKEPCCHRRKFLSELGSVKKERAAASVFQTRASHRPSCSRHVRKERRPSTEIRLGVNYSALQTHEPYWPSSSREHDVPTDAAHPGHIGGEHTNRTRV